MLNVECTGGGSFVCVFYNVNNCVCVYVVEGKKITVIICYQKSSHKHTLGGRF